MAVKPRAILDAQTIVTGTLPNAANTTNTNVIDLGATTPFPVTEKIQVKIAIGTATGANNKNINIRIMDSADNSSFANIALLPNPALTSADANGAGHSASNVVVSLPHTTRRYIKGTALGEANGGNSSDGTFTVSLLY